MAQPHTLQEAFAATYASNPSLQAARAQLRATDEGVPQALAGWRPTIIVGATAGPALGNEWPQGISGPAINNNRDVLTAQVTITQPIYRGGKTQASTNQAKNNVFAQRANLINAEEQVFTSAVNAYVGVIEAQQLLQLNIRNVEVLTRQLQATNDRFRVGEITRTDVAQAEAALAGAIAQRETAEGQVATARATYLQVIGYAPDNLVNPQPLRLPVRSEREAAQLAAANNPQVVAALFQDAAARDAVDVAFSALVAAGQPAGDRVPEQQFDHRTPVAEWWAVHRQPVGADLPGRCRIRRRPSGAADGAAAAQERRQRPPHRRAVGGERLADARRRPRHRRQHPLADHRQRGRARRRGARGNRRQPHHA